MKEQFQRDSVLKVPAERQSTGFSCAAKALQLILHFHKPGQFPLGCELELDILARAKLGSFDVATHPGIAVVALECGFDVEHLVLSDEVFSYPTVAHSGHTMSREEFEEKIAIDRKYFQTARALGLRSVIVPRITSDLIRSYLAEGIPLIAMTDRNGTLHDVVIRGLRNREMKLVDPSTGYRTEYIDHFLEDVHTRYGVSIIAVLPKRNGA